VIRVRYARPAALLLIAGIVAIITSTSASAGATASKESVVFFYQSVDPSADSPKFVGARAVITSDQADDAAAVAAIHASGALAIKYTNVYWYPSNGTYEGVDIAAHLDWAFCKSGNTPYLGRTADNVKWYYIDANEHAARVAINDYFAHLKSLGYDGVFFDRGSAAFRGNRYAITWKASTCTDEPVHARHRRFADVYASVIHDAYNHGLTVYLNYAHAYFSSRLRPDPNDRDCRLQIWSNCTFTPDVWKWLTGVVDENAGGTTAAQQFRYDFKVGQTSERHLPASGVPRLVREIKVKTSNRQLVFYRWARARLFRVLTFVNTGDDRCLGGSDCFRYGTYPELTQVSFGGPVDSVPRSQRCDSSSPLTCLWLRRYRGGVSVINPSAKTKTLRLLRLNVGSCRYVKDVFASTGTSTVTLRSDSCIGRISYSMPPHSGRVFIYSTSPW
jgi:hypothetical protein